MSIKYSELAWEIHLPNGSDKLVLLSLCEHADSKGECFPSIARLALQCSRDTQTVKASLSRLVKLKLVEREERVGRSTLYKLKLDAHLPQDLPRVISTPGNTNPGRGGNINQDPGSNLPPITARNVNEPLGRRKRACETPLPGGWTPGSLTGWTARATAHWSHDKFEAEADAFRNHAHTHDRRCRDWQAAFRSWLKIAVEKETKDERRHHGARHDGARQPARTRFESAAAYALELRGGDPAS